MNDKQNIIDDFKMPVNYPETYSDKAHWAEFCVQKSLEGTARTLQRLSRLRSLLLVSLKDNVNTLPDIITNNEARMALKNLASVRADLEEAYQELRKMYEETKK